MRTGILAKKLGMTSFFNEDGSKFPATLLYVEDCEVTDIRNIEKNNYNAVQLGIINVNQNKINKPQKISFAKSKTKAKKHFKEFRVSEENIINIGTAVNVSHFEKGQFVDVTSISKGKGFAGAMKRHNFSGLRASHGVSISHRAHGSTGQNQDPGKVFKGKKMAGHMGDKLRTMQNIEIIKADLENELLYLKGSIPGSKNAEVLVKKSIKNISKLTISEKIKLAEEAKKTPDKKKKK